MGLVKITCRGCGGDVSKTAYAPTLCLTCAPDKSSVHRFRRYGITRPQFEAMLIQQDNKCILCLNEFLASLDICVDHCHSTGRVRGLLCRGCNMVVSRFEDDEYAARVEIYLQIGGDLPHASEEAEDVRRI